jgi:hypothetical protein
MVRFVVEHAQGVEDVRMLVDEQDVDLAGFVSVAQSGALFTVEAGECR